MQTQQPAIPRIGVHYSKSEDRESARQLADILALPLTAETAGFDLLLAFVDDRLCLFEPVNRGPRALVYAEFTSGAVGFRLKQDKKELLFKAIGLQREKPPSVLDATGGLGRDSFLMASQGCRVHILERNRVVAALLEDGLRRAAINPATAGITDKISFALADSIRFLTAASHGEEQFDVIYLDPMFPQRRKSALVKKEMQLLQKLIGPENDVQTLLDACMTAPPKRIVVKRPRNAPILEGPKPSHSIEGRTTRFDVYLKTSAERV